MNIPTDYKAGYERAHAVAPDIAANYIKHTLIGDPLAEAMTEDLAELSPTESRRFVEAAMNEEGEEALRDAPASLREFFKDAETPPEWLNYAEFAPGVRMFHRNSQLILAAFVAGRSYRRLYNEHRKILLHHRAGARPGRQAFGAEQPSHDGDIPSRRHVQGWRRLETFGPYQDSSRTDEIPARQFGRVGYRSMGRAD